MIEITLLIPYRNRLGHLESFLRWYQSKWGAAHRREVEAILIEADHAPGCVRRRVKEVGIGYVHMPCQGVFHKTRALNTGLARAQGRFIMPFDVDLFPVGDTFIRHVEAAMSSPGVLIAGYRLMSLHLQLGLTDLSPALQRSEIAPEDAEYCVMRHLKHGEMFGISPVFLRERLLELGGWDESFRGWGAEDQDLLERYTRDGPLFVRSPHLIYLHLHHEQTVDWNELDLVVANRDRYYQARSSRFVTIEPQAKDEEA